MKRLQIGQQAKGAEILCEALIREGVKVIFGYPGGANIPIYDALPKFPQLKHVLVRHEQGAAHAAEGYAWATGKPGVCFATSGPGATNLVTGIADAMLDSIPLVAITGQVASPLIGTDAFQETDVVGITIPITKHNKLITNPHDIGPSVAEAFYIATHGRPGPVLLDISKDAQSAQTEFSYPKAQDWLRGKIKTAATSQELTQVANALNNAKKPLIVAGHGVLLSHAQAMLQKLAEKQDIPVTLTHMAISALPNDHKLFMGSPGMHGNVAANRAPQQADVILALGMRFHDRVTGAVNSYAKKATIIHVDIDASEIDKIVQGTIGIVADAREFLQQLLPLLKTAQHPQWIANCLAWKQEEQEKVFEKELASPKLTTPQVIHELSRQTNGTAIVVPDVGQNQMYAVRYYTYRQTNSCYYSGGLGTMGFALPAGIGAKFGKPDREVWIVVGDGGFQMTMQEMMTIAQENLEVKILLLNNGYLGMVRQWQELFHNKNYSQVALQNPNFQKISEGFGIPSRKATSLSETKKAIAEARQTKGPFLVECTVAITENVFPMIPAGKGLDDMIICP